MGEEKWAFVSQRLCFWRFAGRWHRTIRIRIRIAAASHDTMPLRCVPKCLFVKELEGLTEVSGWMSAGTSRRRLALWADFFSKKNQRATTKGQNRLGTFSHFSTHFHTFFRVFRIFPPGLFLELRGFATVLVWRDEKRIKEKKESATCTLRSFYYGEIPACKFKKFKSAKRAFDFCRAKKPILEGKELGP